MPLAMRRHARRPALQLKRRLQLEKGSFGPPLLTTLLLTILLLAGPVAAAEIDGSTEFQGRPRGFRLHLPGDRPGTLMPMVLALHGAGASGAAMRELTGFDALADREGFATLYPDGTPAATAETTGRLTWNAGFCCGAAVQQRIDDVGFLAALLDKVEREYGIDPNRVYVTGFSNGGMMAYRLAAEHPERIAALAVISGAIGGTGRDGTSPYRIPAPARPVPVMIVHGRQDPNVLFDGGISAAIRVPGRVNLSVGEALALWSQANGCPTPASLPDPGAAGDFHVLMENCRAGSAVELWALGAFGHGWPQHLSTSPSTKPMPSATEAIWAFFKRFGQG
jgi:polyhydroxybutyrate depolymerase